MAPPRRLPGTDPGELLRPPAASSASTSPAPPRPDPAHRSLLLVLVGPRPRQQPQQPPAAATAVLPSPPVAKPGPGRADVRPAGHGPSAPPPPPAGLRRARPPPAVAANRRRRAPPSRPPSLPRARVPASSSPSWTHAGLWVDAALPASWWPPSVSQSQASVLLLMPRLQYDSWIARFKPVSSRSSQNA